ncbi:MAG: 7TM diverse intracellular signaling domain-containing protein [Bdellovibrionota bacterium]
MKQLGALKKFSFRLSTILYLSLIAGLLSLSPQAFAVRELPLSMEHIEDKPGTLDIEQILTQEAKLPWQATPADNPRFGYTKSHYWFRFHIPENKLKYGPKEPLFLEIPYVYLAKISLYATLNGKVISTSKTGLAVPVSERDSGVLRTGQPVFRISPPRSAETEYFISIAAEFPLALPTNLIEGPDYAFHHWRGMFAMGMFVGLLLLAALFNGFLAASLRSRMYFNYSIFVIFITLLYLAHEGLSIQFFWPDSPWWALREMHAWGGLVLIFYALFVREFLSSRETCPLLDRLLFMLVGISTFRSIWLMFGPNQIISMLGETAIALSNLLVLAISAVALYRGVKTARYFVMSSLAFNVAIILFLLHETNTIDIGDFVLYAPHFGTAAEVILLSLALADRIRGTDRELAEQKAAMILSDKLAALGRMAGEVAHEINNPLAIIHANAVMIRERAGQISSGGEFNLLSVASTIEQTSLRISRVVKGMRALSRDSRHDPMTSVALATVLQDSVALCEERYRKNGVTLESPAAGTDITLRCRSSDICQVIVNLLNNALDAVETSTVKLVKLEASVREGFVEIAVIDSGPGIPAEVRKRIMEPFFTTKEPGKGLGLGLSISRTIVESHGGKLWLDETSKQTRFVFTLPLEEA